MSVFDIDSNIEHIDDNIRKYQEDILKESLYIFIGGVQSKNDLYLLDNICNGMIVTVYDEGYCLYIRTDDDWIKI